MSSTTYANTTVFAAFATRSCTWRTRSIGHGDGGSQAMFASALPATASMTAMNATKRSPRRLAERLT